MQPGADGDQTIADDVRTSGEKCTHKPRRGVLGRWQQPVAVIPDPMPVQSGNLALRIACDLFC